MIECDMLVVGSSIAGASAARSAALNGAKTIMIEEKENSIKAACAEAISSYLLPLLPFEIPKTQLVWNIKGIKLHADDFILTKKGNDWEGFSIERDSFNPWLVQRAAEAGAKLYFNTKLIDLDTDRNNFVKKVIVEKNNKKREIRPKIVVAADGVKSNISKLLGVRKERKYSLAHITSFEFSNLKIKDPHMEQIFFGDFAPNGFAYIFPKSRSRANVGVGSVGKKSSETKKFFDNFLEANIVKRQLEGGIITRERSGYAPVDYIIDKTVYGNTIFVGDIANQNIKPFIEGIIPGIVCGDLAGKCAVDFIRYGYDLYEHYTNKVKQKFGEIIQFSDSILKLMIKIFEQENRKNHLLLLALCTNMFDFAEYDNLFTLSYMQLRKEIEKIISYRN